MKLYPYYAKKELLLQPKIRKRCREGIIAHCIAEDGSKGILVEVNCETDFVAKNEDFINFSKQVATELLANPEADLESKRTEQVAKIGENIRISRFQALAPAGNAVVQSYVHTGSKVAVLIAFSSDDGVSLTDQKYLDTAKDLCMHIAATPPVCISREDVPADLIEKERDIAKAQAEGKPPQAIEKIVLGKLEKYFSTSCLLEQPFVKNPEQTIGQLLENLSKEAGHQIKVEQFLRFQVGEEN